MFEYKTKVTKTIPKIIWDSLSKEEKEHFLTQRKHALKIEESMESIKEDSELIQKDSESFEVAYKPEFDKSVEIITAKTFDRVGKLYKQSTLNSIDLKDIKAELEIDRQRAQNEALKLKLQVDFMQKVLLFLLAIGIPSILVIFIMLVVSFATS